MNEVSVLIFYVALSSTCQAIESKVDSIANKQPKCKIYNFLWALSISCWTTLFYILHTN